MPNSGSAKNAARVQVTGMTPYVEEMNLDQLRQQNQLLPPLHEHADHLREQHDELAAGVADPAEFRDRVSDVRLLSCGGSHPAGAG